MSSDSVDMISSYNDYDVDKTILDLPDHFMISVIQRLSLKERIRCSRVCKKWNRLSKDPALWTIIDIREHKREISLNDLKKLIHHFGSASTKELLICGNYTFDYCPIESLQISLHNEYKQKRLNKLDSEFFSDFLNVNCPNLSLLSLEYLDLSEANLEECLQLKNLQTFSLKWCLLVDDWFNLASQKSEESIESNNKFNRIQNFYLIRTGLLKKEDIENICQCMPGLVTLTINQAVSSLGDDSIGIICENLKNIKQLDLINTVLSDHAISIICNSTHLCSNLNRLNLTMSSKLSNACLNLIAENLHNLNTLYLTSCFGISNINFLQNLKNLIYLNINNTSIDKGRIKEFLLPNLPKCEVEYGHAKMLNGKLMWTINSSRNSVCSF